MREKDLRTTRAATGKENLFQKRSHKKFRNNFFSSRFTDERLKKAMWRSRNYDYDKKEAGTVNMFKRLDRRHREGTVALATEGGPGDQDQNMPSIYKFRALDGP